MKGIEKRLEALEASKSGGFKLRSLVDLVNWPELGGEIPPDLSECDDELLRQIYESTKDDEEGVIRKHGD